MTKLIAVLLSVIFPVTFGMALGQMLIYGGISPSGLLSPFGHMLIGIIAGGFFAICQLATLVFGIPKPENLTLNQAEEILQSYFTTGGWYWNMFLMVCLTGTGIIYILSNLVPAGIIMMANGALLMMIKARQTTTLKLYWENVKK